MTRPTSESPTFQGTCQEAYDLLTTVVDLVETLDPPITQHPDQRALLQRSVARKALGHLSAARVTLARGAQS